jgi:hypothetical protein
MHSLAGRTLAFVLLSTAPIASLYAQPTAGTGPAPSDWHARAALLISDLQPNSAAQSEYVLLDAQRQDRFMDAWTTISETTHAYDGAHRVESTDHEWNGFELQPTFRTTFTPDGQVEAIDLWDSGADDFVPETRYSYEYQNDLDAGQTVVSVATTQLWSGVGWADHERTTYAVESAPSGGLRVIGGVTELGSPSGWAPYTDFVVQEVAGDVVHTIRFWSGSGWTSQARYTYRSTTIQDLDARIRQLAEEYRDAAGLNLGLLSLPDMEVALWSDAQQAWLPNNRRTTEAFHFGTGKPAVMAYQAWNGAEWIEDWRHTVSYSAEGRAEASTVAWSDGQVLVETYAYDERGLMTEAVTEMTFESETIPVNRLLLSWEELSVDVEDPFVHPSAHTLLPAWPNPFNPSTAIAFELSTADRVTISVFDMLGKRVAMLLDADLPARRHEVTFDASALPSGLYLVRMQTPATVQSRVVTLIK